MAARINSITVILIGLLVLYIQWKGAMPLFVLPSFGVWVVLSSLLFVVIGILWAWSSFTSKAPQRVTGWFLLRTAIVWCILLYGFIMPLRPLTSITGLQRGMGEDEPALRPDPNAVSFFIAPEERTLVDWLRQFAVNPEPEAYLGQPVVVEGFIMPTPGHEDTLMIAKFLVACCSADARPIGIPIHTTEPLDRDQWVRIEGTMGSGEMGEQRRPVIEVETVTTIPVPALPYEYL